MRPTLIIGEIKYEQGKGYPTTMTSFFGSLNLDHHVIPRYVNRSHTLLTILYYIVVVC